MKDTGDGVAKVVGHGTRSTSGKIGLTSQKKKQKERNRKAEGDDG